MNEGITRYRAVLSDENGKEFAIVAVSYDGSISWSTVSEDRFNNANCDDLPKDLFEQVNHAYGKLNFSNDDVT